jgi:hypothetical protein
MGITQGVGIGSVKPGVCTSTTRPASPFVGQQIFETDTNFVKIWLGSSWSSGYIHTAALDVQYLVIAGGGGGGSNHAGGGAGAGGYRNSTSGETSGANSSTETELALVNGTYAVTVGAGGAANTIGSDSVFSSVTSTGGGRGANGEGGANSGVGGSGGGGSGVLGQNSGAAGTALQGYAGGTSPLTSTYGGGSGGGGAGSVGANSPSAGGSNGYGGNGGSGLSSSITGTAVARAGGGGGGGYSLAAGTATAGGGNGADSGVGANGTANTGGGGGGCGATAGSTGRTGGTGGSGVVIVRYTTSLASGKTITGGTKTTSGTYTIHTFTSSGSLVIA